MLYSRQGEIGPRTIAGAARTTRRWASLRQHVSSGNDGGKPRVELLFDTPGSKPSTPSSQPHTPNTPRTPHTPPIKKSNWEVIEHFTGAPRPSIITVSCSTFYWQVCWHVLGDKRIENVHQKFYIEFCQILSINTTNTVF